MGISKYVYNNQINLSEKDIRILFDDRLKNKDLIIKSHLALALSLAKSFSLSTGYDIEELYCVAVAELLNSIETYDQNNLATFTTYTNVCITNKLINTHYNIIKISSEKLKKGGYIPKAYTMSSFDYNVLNNIIHDDDYDEDTYDAEKTLEIINCCTTEKEADIIIKKIGLTGDTMSFIAIGKEYNITGEGIRIHYNKGINKLRELYKINLTKL